MGLFEFSLKEEKNLQWFLREDNPTVVNAAYIFSSYK